MISDNIRVNVNLWGINIGKLRWDAERHCSVFQFSDEYQKLPYDICPSTHPKGRPLTSSFYGNTESLYQGLPEFLADALPDKWGSSLFDQWLTDNNIMVTEIISLQSVLTAEGERRYTARPLQPLPLSLMTI